MHYYQHHIGDFIKDTSFLTNEEVGIYLKLLWIYYDTEQPLPNSLFELSMKVNARDHQDALSGILGMFFKLENNEWHHTRCDKEIRHYHQQLDTASKAGKASAAKRALNKTLTPVERPLDLCSTDVQPTNNQQPLTNNHKPKRENATVVACPPDVEEQVWKDWQTLRKMKKAPITETVVDSAKKEAAKANMSFNDFLVVWCRRGSQGLEADWLKPHERQSFAQQAADVARTTVPARNTGPDPVLLQIEADRKNAKPIPDEIRQYINKVARKI
jgi:uncharacterized protein YdaU (DUF1376 family)